MKKTLQLSLILIMIFKLANAQTVVTLQPNNTTGVDAIISSYPAQASLNYGSHAEFNAVGWTVSGTPVVARSLLYFNLSAIPQSALITSALLSLYYDSASSNGGGVHSGSNAAYLKRVTASWTENAVTWNNQPSTTTANQVSLPASTSGTQDYTNIDVTIMLTDMIANPSTNYGFMLQLQNENFYKALLFASSDFPVASKRPKLVISYINCGINAVISSVGSNIHCANETDTLFGPSGAGYTYQWKMNNSAIPGATTKDYITSAPGTNTYACDVTQNSCTVTSNSIDLSFISGPALPAITITTPQGSTQIPCNSNLNITAPAGYSSYEWYLGGVLQAQGSNTYLATQAGNYNCKAFLSCGMAISNTLALTVVSSPGGVISATPTSIPCAGGHGTLSVPSVPGAYYQWYKYGSPMDAQTAEYLIFATVGEYTCDITVAGCPTYHTPTYILTGPPAITYVPPFNSCNGTLLKATPGASSYQWKNNGVDILFANTPSYQASSSGNYTCQITTANCGSGISNAIQTSFPTIPTPYLTTNPPGALQYPGGTSLGHCGNVAFTVYPPAITYTWHTPWGTVSGGQSLVPSVSGYYWCDVSYGCSGINYTTTYYVSVLPGLPVPVSTSYISCSSVSMFVSQAILNSQWRKNGVNIAGATGHSYSATTTGYYSCEVSNGCGSQISDSLLVTITGPPSSEITPLGPLTFCTGGNVVLKAPVVAGNTYKWYLNSVQVGTDSMYTATSSGTYRVTVTKNNCSSSDSVLVAVLNPPLSVITPVGNLTFCSGDSVKLNASTGAGYSWQWLKNGVNINGATSSSYTAKASGSYSVLVTATCSVLSSPVTVTVNAKPAPAITNSGPLTFCNGDSVVLSTSNTVGATYQWKKNGNVIAGATSFKYTAKTAGTYKVVKTNSLGCSGTSSGKIVTIDNPTATITAQGPTSFCQGDSVVLMAPNIAGYIYQWKKFNNNIAGATGVSYTAKTQATYKVLVTNATGCTKLSPGVVVTVPCREGETGIPSGNEITVYPNPFDGNFTLQMNNVDPDEQLQALVYDVTGKLIEQLTFRSETLVTGQQLSPGIYEIVVRTASGIKKARVVKMPAR